MSSVIGIEVPASHFSRSSNFDVSSVDQGWQSSTVTAIVQSDDGYLWLGTYNGLLRYDGVQFKVFDAENTPGLRNGRVTSLFEDSAGILWIGHETGELTRLADRKFEPVPISKSWPGGGIECIATDGKNDLWLENASGALFRVRDGSQTEVPGGGSASRKPLLLSGRAGQVWIAANGQAATLENGKATPFPFKGALESDYFQAVLPAHDSGVRAIVNGDLKRFHDGAWELEQKDFPGPGIPVTAVLETHDGALLAGTLTEGLFVALPEGQRLHFSHTNGLSHDWVRALCEDLEGNIWIGTGSGLDSMRSRKVTVLNPPDHWHGRAVLSFAARADGSAWIGTEGAGLYRLFNGEWTVYSGGSGLANLFVWSVLSSQKGDLFVGTWGGGLYYRDGDKFQPETALSTNAAVVALFESSGAQLWVGTTAGLFRFEGRKCTWSAGPDQLAIPNVRAITEGADGAIYFGMLGGGLGCYKDGTLRQYRRRDGLNSDFVQCLLADPDGTLWFGTSDNGLGRWQGGRFASIGTAQGLPDRSISHLLDDGAGHFWLGSHGGILRVSKADLTQCADGALKSIRCLTFGKAEGLTSLTCSGGFYPGACKSADGLLWFPTTRGLAVIDPANVTTNRVEPPVVIEELLADGAPVELNGAEKKAGKSPAPLSARIEVPPGKKRFEIHYTGLSFAVPEKVMFRYRLEGLETEWRDVGPRRVAEYNYLRPGTYTFRVTACNNDEVWNQEGALLTFTVLERFWQTRWFQFSAMGAGIVVVAAVARWITRRRLRAHLEQLERQQALERERARIARDIHDDLGASLTRISLLSQTVRGEVDEQSQAAQEIDQIYGTALDLTRAMDEIVWAVNPRHDSLDSLVTYLGRFAQNFLSAAGIRCRLDVPLHLPNSPLTSEIRHNVFLAFKEALHNIIKHASASEVRVSLEMLEAGFILTVVDNGTGFATGGVSSGTRNVEVTSPGGTRLAAGNGLQNMCRRLEEIGGSCQWESAPGEGTRVKFRVQLS